MCEKKIMFRIALFFDSCKLYVSKIKHLCFSYTAVNKKFIYFIIKNGKSIVSVDL